MTSSYTSNKRLEKPANGDYNNTWSTPVNGDWDIIDRAFGGTTILNAVGASGIVALSVNNYQAPLVAITGALTANVNYQLPASVGGFWFVFNNTSGSFSVLFSSAGGGSTVTLAQGVTTAVICDGTNVGRADTNPPPAGGSTTQVQYNNGGFLNGSANFVFDGSGNVGIGTGSPTVKLDVNGSAKFGSAVTTGTGVSTGDAQFELGGSRSGNGPAYMDFHATAGGDFNARVMRYGGTNGGMDIINLGTGGMVLSQDGAAPILFKTATLDRMAITGAGSVGIGTVSPSTALQVVGTVTATSFTGAGTGLTGTASALSIGGNAATATSATTATTATTATSATTAGSVTNAVAFNNGGSGAASGTTFNGSAAQTISYNTVGAPSTSGTNATGTWGISISGNAATATSATTATNATNAASLVTANFTVVQSGTDLLIKYNGTNIAKISSAGAFTAIDNVTAYGTV